MKFKSIFTTLIVLIALMSISPNVFSQEPKLGTIKGRVLDTQTKSPIPGVSVFIVGTKMGAHTDIDGNFVVKNIPIGSYNVKFASIGFDPFTRTDVIVRPKRITFLQAELSVSPVKIDEIVVTGGFFQVEEKQPASSVGFTGEEIRRSAGSAGDVSRIMSGLPSVSKINDSDNSLIVRGGSPAENSFYVDNIEIRNINHYPIQGSSGGPIGLLNVDFIDDVTFHTGGFSSSYGDKLSSVMEITFREGNRDEFDGQLDLNFAGFGITAEGPINEGKGSWLVSARKSFLDLLVGAIGDVGSVPKYSDYHGKFVYDLSPKHRVTVLEIVGIDFIDFDLENSLEDSLNFYGKSDIVENITGINWRYLWGENGYSNTSLSLNFTDYDGGYWETRTESRLFSTKSVEQEIKIRNVDYYRFNSSHEIEFGFDAKQISMDYDYLFEEYTDPFGNTTPPLIVDEDISTQKYGAFVSYSWRPFSKLNLTPGARFDYFAYNENKHFSPRFSFSYDLTNKTSINGATGIFRQNMPLVLLSQQPENKNLKDLEATHFVVGIDHLLTENTKVSIEVYDKEYIKLPLDPAQPELSIIDEVVRSGLFFAHEELSGTGKAYARGVELLIQKKLKEKLYGLISGSYSRSRYQDYNGTWRDRAFDNKVMLTIEGGYKPNHKWEYSTKFVFAGGSPYTPFDITASEQSYRGVLDNSNVMGERKPAYHSLNLRVDRRFHFKGSNLILFVSAWNVYGRENVAGYYWNELKNEQDEQSSWGFLPVFGLEYEF
jgi:hypothetical protein